MDTSQVEVNLTTAVDSDDDHEPAHDLNHLACRLRNAVFAKFVSDYLTEKADEMWLVYETRIDRILRSKRFEVICDRARPQTAVQLEALAKEQQEVIRACRRDIEALCSSPRRQWRSEEKLSVRLQTKQPTVSSSNWIGVPKTPRCIDRHRLANQIERRDAPIDDW